MSDISASSMTERLPAVLADRKESASVNEKASAAQLSTIRSVKSIIVAMLERHLGIREASLADAGACAAIYAPYVTDTAITFELEPPSAKAMSERISASAGSYAWLVLEDDGRVIGYAYGSPYKSRPAYRWACEVSIYIAQAHCGTGGGRRLYEALLERLAERGYWAAVAVISLPNEASLGLHRKMGFEPVGTLRSIGWKNGAWYDITLAQKQLVVSTGPPVDIAQWSH